MSTDHYVIIGNGPAGNHAAATLRKNAGDARITVLSDECIPYYYKPKLTGFIADEISKEQLIVKTSRFYEENDIRIRLGQIVEHIDVDSRVLSLKHKETIQYTRLIIASGSRARVLPTMEKFAHHLKFVSSYTDVMDYKSAIKQASDFFIFGGDLVGFKFIRMLKAMGKNVIVLIYPHAFWPYNLNDQMLANIRKSLSMQDVTVLIKDDISNIDSDGKTYAITTAKGFEINADMVFSFNGLDPDVGFLKGSSIDCDHGVLVDEYLKTSNDDVYACGSCAQIYNPEMKSYCVSIGWPNAIAQGETAALNLLGSHQGVESAGRKYFDMEGIKIKTTWWEDVED